jgi:hypothetical protein
LYCPGADKDGNVPVVLQIVQRTSDRQDDKIGIRCDLYKVSGTGLFYMIYIYRLFNMVKLDTQNVHYPPVLQRMGNDSLTQVCQAQGFV